MEKTLCVHCGASCGKNPIMGDGLSFCCLGCRTVYRLLKENKLYRYYEIEDTPGIKIDQVNYNDKYAYLDQEEVISKLLEFREGKTGKVTFYIPSIHCSSCIWLLENLHRIDDGIVHSEVNFNRKQVHVTFNMDKTSLRKIVEELASVHYVPVISLENIEGTRKSSSSKSLVLQIGVAGFCFGNVMLLSFPEYLSDSFLELSQSFRVYFNYLIIAFTIPSLLYSAKDYVLTGIKNLLKKNITIDLPITIGIVALFSQSMIEIIAGTGQGYLDSLTGFIFFILIGKWYQGKTYSALSFDRDYKSYFPVAVTRIRNGVEKSVMIRDLEEGDKILIRNQELIPCDAVLVSDNASIDYSFVTGESDAVVKTMGELVYAGGRQVGSTIELEVVKKVSQSRLTQLWTQDSGKQESRDKGMGTTIDKVSRIFTLTIIGISVMTAIFWLFINPDIALGAFTSVLIVACPCALALSLPFTFGNIIRLLGKAGVYLKNTQVVERLAKIDTVVFDKTGTITRTGEALVDFDGASLSRSVLEGIKSLAKNSTHPASVAIFNSIETDSISTTQNFNEYPGKGIEGDVSGSHYKMGSAEFVLGENMQLSGTVSKVFLSVDGELQGVFNIVNNYRKGLEGVLNKLNLKYKIHLLSGDNDGERRNLTGLFKPDQMHFNQAPADKRSYIANLKNSGSNVMMIGDGLNDAGALMESDAGISIADNIFHFSPACDVIVESDSFTRIPGLIEISRKAMVIVKISFGISVLYNLVGLSFAVRGMLSPIVAAILMPMSSVTVVAFVTMATGLVYNKFK